jgi:hypothetical protein
MDKELLIEKSWLSYRSAVIPQAVGVTQVTECRRAFYSGAAALYATIMTILDPGQEATENDLRTMGLIDAELRRFGDQVKVGLK